MPGVEAFYDGDLVGVIGKETLDNNNDPPEIIWYAELDDRSGTRRFKRFEDARKYIINNVKDKLLLEAEVRNQYSRFL